MISEDEGLYYSTVYPARETKGKIQIEQYNYIYMHDQNITLTK